MDNVLPAWLSYIWYIVSYIPSDQISPHYISYSCYLFNIRILLGEYENDFHIAIKSKNNVKKDELVK